MKVKKELSQDLAGALVAVLLVCIVIIAIITNLPGSKGIEGSVIATILGGGITLYVFIGGVILWRHKENKKKYDNLLPIFMELETKVKEFENIHRNAKSILEQKYLKNFHIEMDKIIAWQLSIIEDNYPINSIDDIYKFDHPIKKQKFEFIMQIKSIYVSTIINHLQDLENEIRNKIDTIEFMSKNKNIYQKNLELIDFSFLYENLICSITYELDYEFANTPLWTLQDSFDQSYRKSAIKNMEISKYLEEYHNHPPENFINKGFTSEDTYKNIVKKRILEINSISERIQENF